MPAQRTSLNQAGRADADAASTVPDEDFLYHLYRGSALLLDDRVGEAKEELERALRTQPADAKGQDLLGSVYFRLGMYPRAIEIFRGLVKQHPREVTLRVNLGLCLLKTGQPADAIEHLEKAVEIDTRHDRAWAYLGLALWRLGKLGEARDAFVRGGQDAMARRMADTLASSAGVLLAPNPGTPSAEQAAAIRSAAEQALEDLGARPIVLAVESPKSERAPLGTWRAVEPGEELVPRRPPSTHVAPANAPPPLDRQLETWQVAMPRSTSIALSARGELVVHAPSGVYARASGLRAVRGTLATERIRRRFRGRELEQWLGGAAPLLRWRGPVSGVLACPDGMRFHAMTLGDDLLFTREDVLWAFESGVSFECGELPTAGGPVPLVQLAGAGVVVLCVAGDPSAVRVREGEECRCHPRALVGWTGRLFPDAAAPQSGDDVSDAAPLAFRGDGVLLLT